MPCKFTSLLLFPQMKNEKHTNSGWLHFLQGAKFNFIKQLTIETKCNMRGFTEKDYQAPKLHGEKHTYFQIANYIYSYVGIYIYF